MTALIRPQPPRTSGALLRQAAKLVATPAGGWFFVHVANRIDKVLIPASKGRVRLSLTVANVILIHTGAKSGAQRRTPLVYFTEGDDVILIASNGGAPRHPAWYHNVRAHPEVEISDGKVTARYVGREADGAERERLWAAGLLLYPGWATYQRRAGERRIPIMVFSPLV